MFPSYTNKTDRENKYKQFAEQYEYEQELDTIKQEAYKNTLWPSDVKLNVVQNGINASTNTETLRLPIIETGTQSTPSVSAVVSSSTQTTTAKTKSKQTQSEPEEYEQQKAREELVSLFNYHPELIMQKFHPISKNDTVNKNLIIGKNGVLFHTSNPQINSTADKSIDWIKTLAYIKLHSEDKPLTLEELSTSSNSNSYEKIQRLFKNHPELSNQFNPIDRSGMHMEPFILSDYAVVKRKNGSDVPKNRKYKMELQKIDWDSTFQFVTDIYYRNHDLQGDTSQELKLDQEFERLKTNMLNNRDLEDIEPDHPPFLGLGFSTSSKLVGRGFRGAGISNDALYKDYLYRPIGSKFINLKALNEGYLSLRHPGGSMISKKLKLSNQILSVLKLLVFDGKLDSDRYNLLSENDKKIFYDILKVAKLTNNFKHPIHNPNSDLEQYRIELDKLIGELTLGNTNTAIKNELKKLSIHMYQNKLINDSEFNQILKLVI